MVTIWGWRQAQQSAMQEVWCSGGLHTLALRCKTAKLLEIRVDFLLTQLAAEVHCGACLGGRRGLAPASDVRMANFTL